MQSQFDIVLHAHLQVPYYSSSRCGCIELDNFKIRIQAFGTCCAIEVDFNSGDTRTLARIEIVRLNCARHLSITL